MWSVKEILDAKSIAVIGASRDPEKPGARLLQALREVGFSGQIAGVNPQGGQVFDVPLYPSLDEIPFPVDLTSLLIPPSLVPQALRECARKGVKGVVISAEGFAETGFEGSKIQDEVRAILQSTGMRAFGPNTLGLINTATGLTTSYLSKPSMLKPGSIGFVTQSGILVGALLRYMSSQGGFELSKGIGLGNKVDVNESEALSYLLEDEQTKIIGLYLEDVRDGREFLRVAKEATKRKPVLLLKGGRTREGARAAASHTASMAMEDRIFEGAIRQTGILRQAGIDEFLRTLKGFLHMPLPAGRRIAIATYSGAQGIMSIDAAMEEGLELARLSEAAGRRISRVIAAASKRHNPIDFFPDILTQGFEKISVEILQALLEDQGVDGIIVIYFPHFGPDPLRPVVDLLQRERPKPVFFSLMGDLEKVEPCRAFLEKNRIPCYEFPEMAVRVFSQMWKYAKIRGGT